MHQRAPTGEPGSRCQTPTPPLCAPDKWPVLILILRVLKHAVGIAPPVVLAAQQLALGIQACVVEGRLRPRQRRQLASLQGARGEAKPGFRMEGAGWRPRAEKARARQACSSLQALTAYQNAYPFHSLVSVVALQAADGKQPLI